MHCHPCNAITKVVSSYQTEVVCSVLGLASQTCGILYQLKALECNLLALSLPNLIRKVIIGIKFGYWNVLDSHVVGLRPGRGATVWHLIPISKLDSYNIWKLVT